jgi:hypothetical protein
MRILLVGPGINGKYGDRFYYSYSRRIANGLILNGHFVFHVSDRDIADYFLKLRKIGALYANRRIVQIAKSLQPQLLLLLHADLITENTVTSIRRFSPECRIAVVDFDSLAYEHPVARFRRMLSFCDVGFATTGGVTLKAAAMGRPAHFIPNPVDTSMDDQMAYSGTTRFDVFFAAQKRKTNHQWQRALRLQELAPALRYSYNGSEKRNGLWGFEFVSSLASAKIGLNLNAVEGDYYASDRMAQYLGNGLLLATDRKSGYDRLFSDDEMIFFSSCEELAEKCQACIAAGDDWRRRAEKSRTKALSIMSNRAVAEFIVNVACKDRVPEGWAFSGV